MQAFVAKITSSRSASPYSSAGMLEEYVNRGFPNLPEKIIQAIDQQVAHRQELERFITISREKRENRAQLGAIAIGVLGLLLASFCGYLGVSSLVCGTIAVAAIGGPNAATILARWMDRMRG